MQFHICNPNQISAYAMALHVMCTIKFDVDPISLDI